MADSALLTPLRHADSKPVGPRVFRKQVLPKDTIRYDGRDIEFDDEYLSAIVDSFQTRVFEQVPFTLADPSNRHTEDPERFRGEVKGLELTADGVDAIIEVTNAGAELIERNPRLGVSARILEGVERADGRRAPVALRHICGTLDPEIAGMRGWESLSDLSAGYGHIRVVDLTAATYTSEMPEPSTDTLSADELARLRKLLGEENANDSTPPSESGVSGTPVPAGLPDDLSPDETQALAEVVELMRSDTEGDPEDSTEDEREPVAAGAELSADAKRAIDLAASEAKRAQDRATALERQLAEKDFEALKREYVEAGVPPAAVDLAKPALMQQGVIDLSGGDKLDIRKIAGGLLDELKGTIDLSGETATRDGNGRAYGDTEQGRDEAKQLLAAMSEEYGGPKPKD